MLAAIEIGTPDALRSIMGYVSVAQRPPGLGLQLFAVTRQTRQTTDPGWPQGDYVLYYWGGPGGFRSSLLRVAWRSSRVGLAAIAGWI